MRVNAMIAAAVAAALALPLVPPSAAHAQAGASAVGTGPTGGVPRTGGPDTAPSAGEPLDFTGHPVRGFSQLDTNRDGHISRAEWDHAVRPGREGDNVRRSASSGPSILEERAPASSPMGVTAGPGMASPRTAAGSATATKPGTSGFGRAQ